jgi:hypothetical protein
MKQVTKSINNLRREYWYLTEVKYKTVENYTSMCFTILLFIDYW